MNTKEICRKLSVTPKMLRVYELQKLIHPIRSGNNYREYSLVDALQIRIIVTLREMGFSLSEIGNILKCSENKNDYLYNFYVQYKAVQEKIKELTIIKNKISGTMNQLLHSSSEAKDVNRLMLECYENLPDSQTVYQNLMEMWDFDQMAANYVATYFSDDMGYQGAIRKTKELIRSLDCPGTTFLDVGCGTCDLWHDFADVSRLSLMDKSFPMLMQAKERLAGSKFILGDILAPPSGIGQYDVVVTTFMLHHVEYEHQYKAISSMLKYCKDAGVLLIIDRGFQSYGERIYTEQALENEGDEKELAKIRTQFYLHGDKVIRYLDYLGYSAKKIDCQTDILFFIIKKP